MTPPAPVRIRPFVEPLKCGPVVPITAWIRHILERSSMKQPISVKPEPRKAQSNWSYQAYFLSQRQRLKSVTNLTSEASAPSDEPNHIQRAREDEQRDQVITKMEALAASIGVRITISDHSSAL